jgi:aryl-alcohol dehydrogenase-like predicted oxidoreductase
MRRPREADRLFLAFLPCISVLPPVLVAAVFSPNIQHWPKSSWGRFDSPSKNWSFLPRAGLLRRSGPECLQGRTSGADLVGWAVSARRHEVRRRDSQPRQSPNDTIQDRGQRTAARVNVAGYGWHGAPCRRGIVSKDVEIREQPGRPGSIIKSTGTGRAPESPLILGGHSFIGQLGNDPRTSEREQHRIVDLCLDRGIIWFDTTYQPERSALGNVLQALGRRAEATILAWNFFTDFSPGEPVGGPEYFRPGHIDRILEQLRTEYLDCLVMIDLDDPEKNQRQQELVIEWQRRGYVRSLGLWISDPAIVECYPSKNPFQFAFRALNVATDDASSVFASCKTRGWETIATSPFFRGWELDRIIAKASVHGYGDAETLRPLVADMMLRYSLFQRDVSRLIVAMRKIEWVTRNLESVARGPLTDEERLQLQGLREPVAKKNWRCRLRRALRRRG